MKYAIGLVLTLLLLSASAQNQLKRPDIPGDLMVDIGFNVWSSMPGGLERNTWRSKSVGIYYTKRKVLSNKFSFNYGLGLGLEKMSLGDSATLVSSVFNDNDTPNDATDDRIDPVQIQPNPFNFEKNRLATTYLDLPVEFRFHPFGTEEGEGLFVGVGGIVGLRLKAQTKWKYQNNGETTRDKTTGKFNLNAFRYGYQIRGGFKGVHLFYKRYVSDVFQDEFSDGFNPVMTTVGINVTGF